MGRTTSKSWCSNVSLCGCNWADSFSRDVIDVTNSIDVTDVTDKSRRNVFVPLTKKARRLICHFHSDELALPKVSGRLDGNSLLPHVLYLVLFWVKDRDQALQRKRLKKLVFQSRREASLNQDVKTIQYVSLKRQNEDNVTAWKNVDGRPVSLHVTSQRSLGNVTKRRGGEMK